MPPLIPEFWLQHPVAIPLRITDRFNAPRDYANGLHEGIDLAAVDARGNPANVLAAQSGIVEKIETISFGYGKYIRIGHDWFGQKWVTWYGHLSAFNPNLRVGQWVNVGDMLGVAGATGNAFGVHLHLTLQHIGFGLKGYSVDDVLDPAPFLRTGAIPQLDKLSFVADSTIRDGARLRPDEAFVKTWRVRNTGTKTWTPGYKLTFDSGDSMGGPESVLLPPARPGDTVEVSVPLVAPGAEGKYRGDWVAQNMEGARFGAVIDVDIEVARPPAPVPRNESRFVADVTIEDGTALKPGQDFVKTWRIRNTGDTTWGEGYTLGFFGGRRMNGPENGVPLPAARPGEIVDISVPLKAPTTPGSYRSTWKPRTPDGQFFEFDLFTDIRVVPETAPRLDEARFVADVTIPDGAQLKPGQVFVKTWRVRNSGNTVWGRGYTFAFFGDERMGGPESVPAPAARPGQVVTVSVRLRAPREPGSYRTTWKFRAPNGQFFEFEMYALIEVTN